MPLKSALRAGLNGWLARFNLRLDTLSKQRQESARLHKLVARGQFEHPVFALPGAFARIDVAPIFGLLERYGPEFAKFRDASRNAVAFSYDNEYYHSPDVEVLYSVVRDQRPRTIVEVGSGNSTRIIRQALVDEGHACELVCVDPAPRVDIAGLADRIEAKPVEEVPVERLVSWLSPPALLFIDSSHHACPGGDVAYLYGRLLPRLAPGTLVHIHDVFLPFEYPREWIVEQRWGWNEQQVVHGMLAFGERFDVLWAGHYLQRTLPGFDRKFPHTTPRVACSLWLRVRPC